MKRHVTPLAWCLYLAGVIAIASSCGGSPDRPTERITAAGAGGGGATVTARTHPGPSGAAPGEKVKQFDLNHDNQPDVWAYYKPMADPQNPSQTRESLVRKEWDFNFDGKVDIRRHFNFKGVGVKDELDLDFDGRFDVVTFYRGGAKLRQEYDFNFDSRADYWKFFEKNVLVRTERDRDFNGRVDRWEYFAQGRLDRIGLDEDGDGQIDKWIQQKTEE